MSNEAEIVEVPEEWWMGKYTPHDGGKLMETYDVAQTAGAAKTRGD